MIGGRVFDAHYSVAREANDNVRSIIYARELTYDKDQLHIKADDLYQKPNGDQRKGYKAVLEWCSWAIRKTVT